MASAANVAVANLQAQLNRFAERVDFSPLTIDGGMGAKTEAATWQTLGRVQDPFASALTENMMKATAGMPRQTVIMENIGDVVRLLKEEGDRLSLPAPAMVAPSGPISPSTPGLPQKAKAGLSIKPPPGAGSWEKAKFWWRQLDTWQQVGLAGGSGLALWFAASRMSGKKKSGGTAGLRLGSGRRR